MEIVSATDELDITLCDKVVAYCLDYKIVDLFISKSQFSISFKWEVLRKGLIRQLKLDITMMLFVFSPVRQSYTC